MSYRPCRLAKLSGALVSRIVCSFGGRVTRVFACLGFCLAWGRCWLPGGAFVVGRQVPRSADLLVLVGVALLVWASLAQGHSGRVLLVLVAWGTHWAEEGLSFVLVVWVPCSSRRC